jgi:nitronate monooxygenase
MRQSLLEAGYDMDRLMQAGDVNFGEKLKPVASEARAWKTVWSAGHGVSAIQDVPTTAALVDRLAEEYRAARQRLG